MFRLLKIELKKNLNYKPFIIAYLLYIGLLSALFISVSKINISLGKGMKFTLNSLYSLPDVWQNLTYFASWFNGLLGVIIIILVTNEYSFKTMRQNVIDGLSRFEYFSSKVIFSLFLTIVSTLFLLILGIFCSSYYTDTFSLNSVFNKSIYLPIYLLQSFSIISLSIFIATLFKRQGISIILFLLYIFMIENIGALAISDDSLAKDHLYNLIATYLPLKSFSGMIENPFLGIVGISTSSTPDPKFIIASVIYCLIFLTGSYLVIEKSNL